ncbi:hypothetical protein [Paenarthrobacter nicotinovorans]|uniref:hypothetical protein n=1 Tax=Paenarthrobacter nicotinovorans TaxID=29320 RepID=UPI003D67A49B
MSEPAPLGSESHRGRVWLRLLAVVFTIAAAGSLLLVATDLLIDRPAAGDLFIAFLNALAAAVLWREISKQTST